MRADVHGQQRADRRGLVLGMTLTEMMILIVFVLLMAMAALLHRQQPPQPTAPPARSAPPLAPPGLATTDGHAWRRVVDDLFRVLVPGGAGSEVTPEQAHEQLAAAIERLARQAGSAERLAALLGVPTGDGAEGTDPAAALARWLEAVKAAPARRSRSVTWSTRCGRGSRATRSRCTRRPTRPWS